jgi:hypothetical protein
VELAVGPDLTGTWSKVAQKCRISHGTQLCTLGGTFFLENQGTLDASNPLVQFYLSNDAAFDGGDTLLTESVPRIVRAGRNTRVTFSTALNPGVSASGKFVIAVIDQSDGIGETDELNNVIVFGPVP